LQAEFSDLSIGSYPFQKDGKFGANIVMRGTDEARLETALSQLESPFCRMNSDALYAAIDVTWPSETVTADGPWVHRKAVGAGSRLNATTLELTSGGVPDDIPDRPLFMVRGDQSALDTALENRGYAVKDPVTAYVINVEKIAQASGPTRVFHWMAGIGRDGRSLGDWRHWTRTHCVNGTGQDNQGGFSVPRQ
jgi:hypothetical protein